MFYHPRIVYCICLIVEDCSIGVVTTLAGGGSAGGVASGRLDGTGSAATFGYPYGIAVDSLGIVYVADVTNQLIRKIAPAGIDSDCH